MYSSGQGPLEHGRRIALHGSFLSDDDDVKASVLGLHELQETSYM